MYKDAILYLTRLDLNFLDDWRNYSQLRVIMTTAAYPGAFSFQDKLEEEFGLLPKFDSKDHNEKLRANRILNAGRKVEFDWQVQRFFNLVGVESFE